MSCFTFALTLTTRRRRSSTCSGKRVRASCQRHADFTGSAGSGVVMTTILFLHGWHSVPGGVKPTYLKDHGHEVINPALDDDDFTTAVTTAQAEFDKHQPKVVVGSSRGGAVAMNINSGNARLVLLCPAWKNWGTAKSVRPDAVILHSRADDVIPFIDSEELALNSGATLIEVGTDHRLADREPLAAMLRACGSRGSGIA